ncbi:MAG: hypothetical protein ACI4S3_00045 [Candidatus Gastranaerophilaceae bacterium]
MTKRIVFETMLMYADSGYEDHYNYPYDCECIDYEKNLDNGFYARAFFDKPTKQIVISISGTNFFPNIIAKNSFLGSVHDISNDMNMAIGNLPPQIETAIKFYKRVAENNKGVEIIFTGHSLGGSECQIMSKLTGCAAVTFNPFSTGNDDESESKNIINIINSEDFISMSDINTQPGKTYITPNRSGNELMPKFNLKPPAHFLENLRLRDIKEYKTGSIKSYFDKIRSGENLKYEAYGFTLDTIKKVYALWDMSKKLRGWYLGKKHELKQSIKEENTNYTHSGNNRFYLYAENQDSGHWVTINGNHVFIQD